VANARAAGLADRPVLMALNAGITAPNPHNTQAWKFRILSATDALLYVDETRLLPETDPTSRQIHIGQGCLLEVAAVAASGLGYAARVELFPEGRYRVPVDVGRKPIARLTLERVPASGLRAPDPLRDAIARRHTVRSAYGGPAIGVGEFGKIQELVGSRCARLEFVPMSELLQAHLDRHYAAFARETLTRRTAEESRIWFRVGDREIYAKRDGISLRDNGVQGFERWMLETFFLSTEPDEFHDRKNIQRFLERYRANLNTARGQISFITPENSPQDWVLCGRDYARFQLAATHLGLVSRPMSQLLQEFDEMRDLRKEYESFCGVRKPAKIQMIALLGRGEHDYFSPRRPLPDMIF
jgi:hypothetical protein